MAAKPKRILYFEGNVDGTVGGSYFSMLYLASGVSRSRYEAIVGFATETNIIGRFHAAGLRTIIRPVPVPRKFQGKPGRLLARALNFLQGAIVEPLRIAALLRRERVDLLHLNNSITRNHSWMLAARVARIACITHERGINVTYDTLSRRLACGLKSVICISAAVRDHLVSERLDHLPLVTIHNALDPELMCPTLSVAESRRQMGLRPKQRVIGMVGNIRSWKGQDVLIHAIALLKVEFEDIACLLIGGISPDEVSYKKRLDALIAQHGLSDRIVTTGFREDVANCIAALDIQVHASTVPEPFGRVLLEGMALAKPLVASGSGAVPEIVVHGVTGLLFEPGDPEALAGALRKLLRDPVEAARMGHAGRQRLESQFSIAHNVSETEAIYERVFAGRKADVRM